MTWYPAALATELATILEREEARLRAEQATHGLDALAETELQILLSQGLSSAHAVEREVAYPSDTNARRSYRRRCDLVLCPLESGERASEGERLEGERLYVELKVAHQFRAGDRRNARYRTQWKDGTVADLRKMTTDPKIQHAALVLVAFTESTERLEADTDSLERWLADHDVLVGFRKEQHFAIVDRLGHQVCGVVVWPAIARAVP